MQNHPVAGLSAFPTLYAKALDLPCAEGATVLLSSFEPSAHFSLALYTLLPILEEVNSQVRISKLVRVVGCYAIC